MGDITATLQEIAAARRADPLAPVTVVVPSNIAGLQLRRRLAQMSPFAAVRFETLARLAELIAAGHLASKGRSPLARPIGDYVAGEVARQSGASFSRVRELPGYARALRRVFARLRRGGIGGSADVSTGRSSELAEVLRLFDLFRESTAGFYDEEDLLEAAEKAVLERKAGLAMDLGSVVVVPPGAQSAGADRFLRALKGQSLGYDEVEESAGSASVRMIMAPDPASEVREVVREVVAALATGLAVDEMAVFHGADASYPKLLREEFNSARVPAVSMPGTPLSESPAGHAVLALLNLPVEAYPRTRTMDFLALPAVNQWIPAGVDRVRNNHPAWDRVSRSAGITRGVERWRDGLEMHLSDLEWQLREDPRVTESESQTRRVTFERDKTQELRFAIDALVANLEPLDVKQPAAEFIGGFASVVERYLAKEAEGLDDVLREIGQLGTVDAVGGTFDMGSFHEALRANLETGILKEGRSRLGDGVLVADYRVAAGLSFRHVVLCGAYEGALPAGPGTEPLLDDKTWSRLRETHPFVEDTRVRMERNRAAAERAIASASGGTVVWSCPVYEPGATRDYYPSPMMVRAASGLDPSIRTATALRGLKVQPWLQRSPSPLGTMLQGTTTGVAEVTLRQAVVLRRSGQAIDSTHPLAASLEMLTARRSGRFTEWDGNLSDISPTDWLAVRSSTGPTTLETYAKCGFRYFSRNILGLNAIEEPEEREMMGAAERGTLVHEVLDQFFQRMKERGRPAQGERWTAADRLSLSEILGTELAQARRRGQTGRDIFAVREAQLLRADLMRFLDADEEFRISTGAVPAEFEAPLPGQTVGGVTLRGRVDRIDRTPDGQRAWIIDYKTGSTFEFRGMDKDPLLRGTKLQLPAYLSAAGDGVEATALYWFITHKGGFKRIEYANSPENLQRFEATTAAIVNGVRAGAFPAVSGDADDYFGGWGNCGYCEFNRICSRRRDDEHAAKSGDASMAPWHMVASAAIPDQEN